MFGTVEGSTIKNVRLENISVAIDATDRINRPRGPLIGDMYYSKVINCSVSGKISTPNQDLVHFTTNTGGLIGTAGRSSIENSFSTVTIYNNDFDGTRIGGLVGYMFDSTIRNSYFLGNIEGGIYRESSGGLVGVAYSSLIQNCYVSNKSVIENINALVGRLFNYPPPTVIALNFWNEESTSIYKIVGIDNEVEHELIHNYGLTTNEMKQASTYIENSWCFETVWDIDPERNNGYPFLRSNPPFDEVLDEKDITITPINRSFVYPNPIIDRDLSIKWDRTTESKDPAFEIKIYNLRGQIVKTSHEFHASTEHNMFSWNREDMDSLNVSSGVYFYQIKSDSDIMSGRFIIVK
jgi:hypothetical protein